MEAGLERSGRPSDNKRVSKQRDDATLYRPGGAQTLQ